MHIHSLRLSMHLFGFSLEYLGIFGGGQVRQATPGFHSQGLGHKGLGRRAAAAEG